MAVTSHGRRRGPTARPMEGADGQQGGHYSTQGKLVDMAGGHRAAAMGRQRAGRCGRQLEATGGCGRRTLGVMMGGGLADVAGFHHHTASLDHLAINGWMKMATGGNWWMWPADNGEGRQMWGQL